MIVGSSNLTGSGLGSSRDYEGRPQIEANIYTNDKNTLKNAVGFFVRLWGHNTSKEYLDDKYVLSCKSYHLFGIFQKRKKEFNNIIKKEQITALDDGTVKFIGILAYKNDNKAYFLGKTRKDIAVKYIGNDEILNSSKVGEEVEVSGKLGKIEGFKEFTLRGFSTIKRDYSINHLKSGLSQIRLKGEIVNIENTIELETKHGKKSLTLVKIKDGTGHVILELWDNVIPIELIKDGIQLELTNAYTKLHEGELRLGLQKHDGKIKLLD